MVGWGAVRHGAVGFGKVRDSAVWTVAEMVRLRLHTFGPVWHGWVG